MTAWMFLVMLLLLSIFKFQEVNAVSADDYNNLQTSLLKNYPNKVRPVFNQSLAIKVFTKYFLSDINDVDIVQQRLVTTGYLSISWFDDFLQWDKTATGIDTLHIKQKYIWTPDVVLKNGVNKLEELGGEFYYLYVYSDGFVHWMPYQVFETKCDIDITYFPFDTQACNITFISWSFTKLEINITHGYTSQIQFYNFVENPVWDIESTAAKTSPPENWDSEVTFTIHLRRKPLYYVMNLILPVVLLGVTSLLVFVIPADAGEKMSFSVTVFLSFAVFLSIISMQLPVNSEETSLLGVYLVFQMSLGVATIIISAFQLRLHHRCEEQNVGEFYRAIVRLERCMRCIRPAYDSGKKVTNKKYDWRSDSYEPKADYDDVNWKDVSFAIDFTCFWMMSFFVVTATVVLIVIMYNGAS